MSRSTASLMAWLATAVLVAFAVVSIVTGNPAYILWSVVPLIMVIYYFVVAVRGETLGNAKRQRDEQIAANKAAARKKSAAARKSDPASAG